MVCNYLHSGNPAELLDKRCGKPSYLQARPGGKVQFTQSHIDKYFQRIEQEPREKYARKPKKVVAEL